MKRIYHNMIVLDGTKDMTPAEGLALVVVDDRIVRILPQEEALAKPEWESYRRIDLHGQYLTPGLINLHVHVPGSGKPEGTKDPKKTARLLMSNAITRAATMGMFKGYVKQNLLSGATTIRTVGGVRNYDTRIRDLIAAGRADGPRILAGNMAISVPGGHMAGSLAYEATSTEEAVQLVRKIALDKPDLIKLMITGGVLDAKAKGEPGELKMPPEMVKAACEEAHRLGYCVSAHVESTEGVKVALENGVDTIEHGAMPDDEMIRLFKERGAADVATISPTLFFAKFPPEVNKMDDVAIYNGTLVYEGVIECAKACLANGIPVGIGTDTGCPYVPHYAMWREVAYFARYCEVSNSFALHTATLGNARIAGVDGITGSIEEGKAADFIVMPENPIADLRALQNLSLVVANGRPYRNPKVKRMPEIDREMDRYL